jgi:integrase/recombinase XerD
MHSFKQYLESKALSKSTITHYNSYVLDFINWLDTGNTALENSTTIELTAYLLKLQKQGLQNKTKAIRINCLKHYFNWQIQCNKRSDNPAKQIKIQGTKTKKLHDVFTLEQLEKLYNDYTIPSKDDTRNNRNWWQEHLLTRKRNKVALGLLIYQGLTTAEIDRLTENDLQLREGKIVIKGGRKSNERTLELKSHQIMDLMEYQLKTRLELLKIAQKQTNQLFISKGKNIQSNNNWKRLSQVIREQKPKFTNFKQVRASVITHWLGMYNLRQVQYMAGHKYVSSTESYLVNRLEDLQSDIDKYHPMI